MKTGRGGGRARRGQPVEGGRHPGEPTGHADEHPGAEDGQAPRGVVLGHVASVAEGRRFGAVRRPRVVQLEPFVYDAEVEGRLCGGLRGRRQ